MIRVTTQWEKGEDVPVPDLYTAIIGGRIYSFTGSYNQITNNFQTGDYTLFLYNTPPQVSISGSSATVRPLSGQEYIDPMPGHLFSGVGAERFVANKVNDVTVTMNQLTRDLIVALQPSPGMMDNVVSAQIEIDGIAASIGLTTGMVAGVRHKTVQNLATTDGTYTATFRLLGLLTVPPTIVVILNLDDDSQTRITAIPDPASAAVLNTFNANKSVTANITVTI